MQRMKRAIEGPMRLLNATGTDLSPERPRKRIRQSYAAQTFSLNSS
jgi:hypothetical protein